MCVYCEESKEIKRTPISMVDGFAIIFKEHKEFIVTIPQKAIGFKIKFCPMCGKEL